MVVFLFGDLLFVRLVFVFVFGDVFWTLVFVRVVGQVFLEACFRMRFGSGF